MDFFARQDLARRKTKWLIGYFVAAVIGLIVAVYVLAVVLFAGFQHSGSHRHHYYSDDSDNGATAFAWWNPSVFFISVAGVLAVVFCGSAYKTNEFAEGGSAVARLMGGRRVDQNTTDPSERKLLNVVEEMAIASGVPMPQVYVLPEERGINAFAAGHTTGDAAIGVTRGCIELLSRDELQGVVGHEFSHILNGDMRLNLRLIGVIFGLLCLATIGRVLLNVRSGNSRDRNALPLFGLALLILGSIGVFFGRLIQAAVSRQREFLADASSVQFTRNPGGLSGALQKIGGYGYGSKLESHHAPDLCHMFFGNGLGDAFFEPMATHPPLNERIKAIDPAWDGKFQPVLAAAPGAEPPVRRTPPAGAFPGMPGMPGLPGGVIAGAVLAGGAESPAIIPSGTNYSGVLANVGYPTPAHLAYAGKIFAELPESLKTAVRDPLAATAFVYALLLATDDPLRASQLAEITRRTSAELSRQADALYRDLSPLARQARLPLVNVAIGSMRNLTLAQYQGFADTLEWLVDSDGQIELFEFVVQRAVQRHLAPHFGLAKPATVQYYAFKPLAPDCAVILSALAEVGSSDPAAIAQAFAVGIPALCLPTSVTVSLLPAEQCSLEAISNALERLAQAAPQIKRNLLSACGAVVGADGVITQDEAELLRAIADSLDCPTPVALGGE